MNIPATELKKTLKLLSPVRAENFQFGAHGISALDSDVLVLVETPLSALGEFTVAGKKLTQVVNRMSGSVSLTLEGHSLKIKSVKAEIVLEAKPAKKQQIPAIPTNLVDLHTADFKQALTVAVASASPNKSAGFGGVVQFKSSPLPLEDVHPKGYRVVGTDSKVLTVVSRDNPYFKYEVSALLNLTACQVVQLMESETLTYGEGNTGPYLKSGNLTVFANRPDQVYPNIDPLLATKPTVTFQFKPEEWLAAFRTVEPVIEEEEGESKIALHFSESVVGFSTSGTGATARDESGYEQLDPDPLLEPVEMTLVMIAEHLSGFLTKASGAGHSEFLAGGQAVGAGVWWGKGVDVLPEGVEEVSVQLHLTSEKLPEVTEDLPLSEQVMGWYDAFSFDYMRYSLNSGWIRCHGVVGDRPAPYKNPVAWNEILVPDYDDRRRVIGDAK